MKTVINFLIEKTLEDFENQRLRLLNRGDIKKAEVYTKLLENKDKVIEDLGKMVVKK